MGRTDEDRVRRIEHLVRRLELISTPEDRETAQALMEAILELHGAGLERILDIIFDGNESGKTTIRRLAADSLVSSLLVLHGLHPEDIETRVVHALAKAHGKAELLGVFEGIVRVRLTGGGCGVKEAVEAALREAVPDAVEIQIEESIPSNNFVPLASIA
jgi:Fe-S cluster biogenesis protein NfuA